MLACWRAGVQTCWRADVPTCWRTGVQTCWRAANVLGSFRPAHPLTRSPAHPLTRSPAHPLTRSPAHPLTRSPAHPLTRLFSNLMPFNDLEQNLALVTERIEAARASTGATQKVEIIAVTKSHPSEAVEAATRVGLGIVGENRVQEALKKQDELGETDVEWHLIGHLQTNKSKYLPGRFGMVHSIDSDRLARAVDSAATRAGVTLKVLLQVNVAGEEQKFGCPPGKVDELADAISGSPGLEFRGLMTMAPFTDDTGVQRSTFAGARSLLSGIEDRIAGEPVLSMGMSGDFEAAVAEGATHVRLGTVLFGERT